MYPIYVNLLPDDATSVESGGSGPIQTDTSAFNFDAFNDPSLLEKKETETPAEEIAEETSEVETSEEEGQEPTEKPTPQSGEKYPTVPVDLSGLKPTEKPQYPEKRDYSGIDPQHLKAFKGMPNKQFGEFAPIYKALKKENAELQTKAAEAAKTAAPKFSYDHPKGYILSEEYEKGNSEVQLADNVLNHLTEQLALHEAGEKWRPVSIGADGKIILGEETEPTARSKAQIMAQLSRVESFKNSTLGKLESLQTGFADSHRSNLQTISDFESKAFPFWNNLSEKRKADYTTLLSEMPPFLKNSIYGQTVAKAIFTGMIAVEQMQAMSKKQQVTTINGNHQKKAANVKSGTAGTPSGSTRNPFDISDIKAHLKRDE